MMKSTDLPSPCFIIKEQELTQNIIGFQTAFQKYFPSTIFSYSIKTNSLPYVLMKIKKAGGYAEVVSADEYYLAESLGFTNIVYNGVAKTKETFLKALKQGFLVNIDMAEEIDWLNEIEPDENLKLGIRVNVVFPEDLRENTSRFGFSPQNGELQAAIAKIKDLGFNISGLHLHRNTKARSLQIYEATCREAIRLIYQEKLTIKYLDIGGGFYGNMAGKPRYEEYAAAVYEALRHDLNLRELTLVTEPGNAIIASPVNYLCQIKDCKQIGDKIIYTTDGTRNHIDPLFQKSSYSYTMLSNKSSTDSSGERESIRNHEKWLFGASCMEKDVIMRFSPEEMPMVGDVICFEEVGAYTMTLIPNFIQLQPAVYVERNGEYACVRRKWTVQEWIQKCQIEI
ncbi:diaminopimelate decarboxylase [Clostridiales bacterium COT073_COT-073]|nr:diaminopimelate decarboxylase [Clostridiales bacterium COT073_COT-073]